MLKRTPAEALDSAPALSQAAPAAPVRPGFTPERLCRLMREAVSSIGLDLTGFSVLTEAATGAYGVTPIIAAVAGARHVHAFVKPSRHGSVAEARAWTETLARTAGVSDRISVIEHIPDELPHTIDIVTNSGHLRPIDARLIAKLAPTSIIALMFEAWELRASDIDVEACRERSIRIVGVNERHRTIDVFSYLGPLCVRLLQNAGLPVYGTRIALLCDNDFGPDLMSGLVGQGARARVFSDIEHFCGGSWDCVVVALHPKAAPRIDAQAAKRLARLAPNAIVAQFWGDIDRDALVENGLTVWPNETPRPGHMAILLSEIGPEPIIRLQTGGLRAAERIIRGTALVPDEISQII